MTTLSTMRSVVPAILPCDPLFVFVLQCLVRSCMDHRAESHRVCSAASVTSKYGQQIRLHARASLHSSHTRGSVCLVQSRMLATLMSAVALLRDARASHIHKHQRGTQASESLASSIGCSVFASFLVFSFLLFFGFCFSTHFRH